MFFHRYCEQCNYTGHRTTDTGELKDCPHCVNGMREIGEIFLPAGIYYSYRLVENTDLDEYAALSSAQKTHYNLLASCGMVDLSEGSIARSILLGMFGPGTNTRANLVALVGG